MTIKLQETEVKFVKLPNYIENEANLAYSTPDAACFDICAAISEPIILKGGERFAVPTGIKFVPENPIWLRVNSRSGLAAKNGIITIGGILDTDYRGEPLVIMLNTNNGDNEYIIHPGDKIAQIEIPFPYKAKLIEISMDEFLECSTDRGAKGFGSSGR